MKKKLFLICLSLFMIMGVFIYKEDAEAVDWPTYLANQWAQCETKFSNLNKETNLPKWNGTAVEAVDSDGDGFVEVTTPEQFRWAIQNFKSLKLMNDIDMGGLNGTAWAPVAVGGTATFEIEGNNHRVYNLYVSGSSQDALFSTVNNPNFIMKNLTFKYANVRSTAQYTSVVIAHFVRGKLDNVNVEDSIVKGANFTAGLVTGWDTGYKAYNGSDATINQNTGTYINHCHTTRVYTYGTSCVGNFTGPLMGSHVSNSYAVDGVTISTAGHSGGFVSCPGYCFVENSFCNITMYGNTDTAVFSGVDHYSDKYLNCYASGVVEGTNGVGGFLGNPRRSTPGHSSYENCYSTTMVGMQNQAANMGGFVGVGIADEAFINCYAAGEVGTLETNPTPGSSSVGGFAGTMSSTCQNCIYDKQTTAMKECLVGASNSYSGVSGELTQDLIGKLPSGYSTDTWLAHDGMYPQLKAFSDDALLNANFLEADRDIVKAYSAASVSTALLYPSNITIDGTMDKTDYDTVRSIRYLFPFTNDELVKDDSFEISWVADDLKCQIAGMEDLPIISLRSDTYAVASLAPGIGWTTVKVKYYPDPSNKAEYVVGTRRLRLVPTTTLSVATAAGVDHVIYVELDGATKHLGEAHTHYDHRDGVYFSLGSAADLSHNQIKKQPFPADNSSFADIDLTKTDVGGVVDVEVAKQDGKEWKTLELTDEMKSLFLGQRKAERADLGTYRFIYKWYMSGKASGTYLESTKHLTVINSYSVTYMLNDGTNKVYSFDPGAYVEGDTVVKLPDDPSRKGFLFDGWTIKEEETRKARAAGTFDETTPINGDVVVYAGWLPDTFKVKYETEDKKEEEIKTDEKLNLPEEPKKDGYSFTGWTLEPDGEEPIDLDDKTLLDLLDKYPEIFDDPDHEITFYPVFEKNPKPDIKLEVENTTDPDAENVQVNDELKYTVTVSNKEEGSNWKDVTITNTLPEGLTLKGDTVTLRDPEGNEIVLEVKDIYNEETRTIEVPIDVIKGNEEYILEYEVVVNKKTLEDKKDISNTVEVSGKNADGSASSTESESVTPTGGEEILHADPKPEIQITVENKTRPGKENLEVGDELRYTVELTNGQENSKWLDVKVEDILPEGLTVLPESIVIEYPDGHQERVNIKDVYNEETRELSIPVGEIGGNETYKVILDVKVNEKANNLKDGETLGLNIKVNGKTPTGETTDSKGMIVISPEEFKIGAEAADTGDSRTKDMIYIIGALGVSGVCLLFLLLKRKKKDK